MINQEKALEILKGLELTTGNSNILKEPLQLAISALEKQIPKKPIDSYNWEDLSEEERLETPRWYCKSCDGVIEEHYSYCALCSQAIDWSD